MKILQIATEFDLKKLGGAEKMVYLLAGHLSKAGHKVSILTCEDSDGFNNVKIIKIPKAKDLPSVYGNSTRSIFSMLNIMQLFRFKKIFKEFDIIHFHNVHSYSLLFYAMAAARSQRKKLMWTPHDYWFACPKQTFLTDDGKVCTDPASCNSTCFKSSRIRSIFLFRHRTTRKFHSMDIALPTSDYAKKRLIEFGIDKNKIQTVYNGVEIIDPDNDNDLGEHILFIGYLDRRKGTHSLIRAMPEVRKAIPEAQLIFMGDGPEIANLKNLANDLGVKDIVKFTGRLSEKEFEEMFQSARLVVVPSIWPEIFGLVATEAMVRKKAVIASNVGALPEIVQHEKTGLLFEPGNAEDLADKITALYHDEERLRKFGEAGRSIATANFDIDDYSNTIEKLYVKLMSESN